MWSTIAIIVGILLVAILGYAATRPDTFRVARTRSMQAPAEKIFGLINDFHNWAAWSPYEKLDPAMKRTFGGSASGKGAIYQWAGNSKAGEGRMEITDTTPGSRVIIKLDFLKPFEGHNVAEFTMQPAGGSTDVTWAITGPQAFVFKIMSIFYSMDKLLGKDFETGLATIKAIVESKSY